MKTRRAAARLEEPHAACNFREHTGDDVFIFAALERASGVDQAPTRREERESAAEDRRLFLVKLLKIFRMDAPTDFGVPSECAGARAGRVDEDAVEGGGERECRRRVEDHAGAAAADGAEAMEMAVAGNGDYA